MNQTSHGTCVCQFAGVPSPLTDLQLSENGTDHVQLFWRVDLAKDEYPATQLMFAVKLQDGEGVSNVTINITDDNGKHILDNLVPETTYIVDVHTLNEFGRSEEARNTSFQTQGMNTTDHLPLPLPLPSVPDLSSLQVLYTCTCVCVLGGIGVRAGDPSSGTRSSTNIVDSSR